MLHFQTYPLGKHYDWVIFIHGFGGNQRSWLKQVSVVKEHFNLLLIDLPGHGGSSDIPLNDSSDMLPFLADEIIAIIDHLGIEKAHFVGMSLGSVINHQIACHIPDRIYSMVLAGAATHLNQFSYYSLELVNFIKNFVPHAWLNRLFAIIMAPRSDKKARFFTPEAEKLNKDDFLRWYDLARLELENAFEAFVRSKPQFPVLYISGKNDHICIGNLKKDFTNVKTAKLRIIHHAGHLCNLEQPEKFNRLTLEFLFKHAHEYKRAF